MIFDSEDQTGFTPTGFAVHLFSNVTPSSLPNGSGLILKEASPLISNVTPIDSLSENESVSISNQSSNKEILTKTENQTKGSQKNKTLVDNQTTALSSPELSEEPEEGEPQELNEIL